MIKGNKYWKKRLTFFLCFLLFNSSVAFFPNLINAEGKLVSAKEARQLLIRTDQNCEPPEYEGFMLMRNNRPDQEIQENNRRPLSSASHQR